MNTAILLRKVQGKLVACFRNGGWLSGTAPTGASLATLAFSLCAALVLPLIALSLIALVVGHFEPSLALFPIAMGTVAAEERDLKTILKDIDTIEKKYAGKAMPEDEGTKLEALYVEGKALQDAADRRKRREALGQFAKEIPSPAIPDSKSEKEGMNAAKSMTAGYMPIGEFIGLSPEYNNWAMKQGLPGSVAFSLPNLLKVKGYGGFLRKGLVPLSLEQKQAVEAHLYEQKAMPTLGTGVIAPDRLTDIVRDTENDVLTIRDVIPVSPTSSNLIEWLARTSYTRAAAIQSEGTTVATTAPKPEATAAYTLRSAPVRTIPVWMPVSEQQLQDAPALINLIQEDLLWDLGKEEEEQIVWGDGTGVNLHGLEANIDEATNAGGYTSLIDIIRTMITEIRVSGYAPTFTLVHPQDWESIELEKGSDGHYIWAIIRDVLGPRIWGTRVVETVAMDDPGVGTDRLIIVGDRRGATLYDRMQSKIEMGWIDDYFIKNLRAIKAEERVAFAVRRPAAFRKYTVS